MSYKTRSVTVSIATVILVACGQQAPEEGTAASSGMPNMPNMPAASPAAVEHMAHGTVNSIDRAARTVNISHEAVASAGWPAMTMSFRLADPSTVPELAPGQRVEFSFTTDGGGTVTLIAPVE
jgi:Cu(I)/Ag(I) efflux system protein CusF